MTLEELEENVPVCKSELTTLKGELSSLQTQKAGFETQLRNLVEPNEYDYKDYVYSTSGSVATNLFNASFFN